jgi:hypothetical protein
MDLDHMDTATARLTVELRLADITDALANVDLQGDQRATFGVLRTTLRTQLRTIGGEVREWARVCAWIAHADICCTGQ